jgi:hypothetical protein
MTPTPGGDLVVDFNALSPTDTALNGQSLTGVNWASGDWYLSGPWGGFATNSVSFTGAQTSEVVTLPSTRHLVSVKACNGGGSSNTVTLNCSGQTPVSQAVGAGLTVTITTGWTTDCAAITVGSQNGWDTNFDDFVLRD